MCYCTLKKLQYEHNLYIYWETKKFFWRALLLYSLYCGGLDPNLQNLENAYAKNTVYNLIIYSFLNGLLYLLGKEDSFKGFLPGKWHSLYQCQFGNKSQKEVLESVKIFLWSLTLEQILWNNINQASPIWSTKGLYQNYDLINICLTVILSHLWTLASLHVKQEFKYNDLFGPFHLWCSFLLERCRELCSIRSGMGFKVLIKYSTEFKLLQLHSRASQEWSRKWRCLHVGFLEKYLTQEKACQKPTRQREGVVVFPWIHPLLLWILRICEKNLFQTLFPLEADLTAMAPYMLRF